MYDSFYLNLGLTLSFQWMKFLLFCYFWKLLLGCFSTSVSFYLLINSFLRSDVYWHYFQCGLFQWGTWLGFNFFFYSSIFFLIGCLISVSFSFWKSRTAVVDFLAFVTPVGILSFNALLVCLSIEKRLNKILRTLWDYVSNGFLNQLSMKWLL